MDSQKLKVGISACLLGQAVRFDGGHKNAPSCSQVLSQWFEFVPICPEVEIGLGVPRAPIRLINENNQIRVKSLGAPIHDYSQQLRNLADQKIPVLSDLCGYIFMQKSPSCGLHQVKVYNPNGALQSKTAMGAFAYQVKKNFPQLPLEEATRINDIRWAERFIIRVYAYHDWQQHVTAQPETKQLLTFHRRYQLLLQLHDENDFHKLSLIMDKVGSKPLDELVTEYIKIFSECLARKANRGGHVEAMQSILSGLQGLIPAEVEYSIAQLIKSYEAHKVALMVPLTLLQHYVEIYQVDGLMEQKYLTLYLHVLRLSRNIQQLEA